MNRDFGSKPGSGGLMSSQQEGLARRERLKQLALETVDLARDPFFMKNHLGSFECKLCLTVHTNEANYLTHTQAKKHQTNLRRRAAREQRMNSFGAGGGEMQSAASMITTRPTQARAMPFHKIGRPGYRVTKQFDPESQQRGMLFQIHYPDIEKGLQPRHRFLSAYAQKIEAPDPNFQYLLFAARPYETIAFKIPNWPVERDMVRYKDTIYFDWDREKKVFSLQIRFIDPAAAAAAMAAQ